MGDPNYTKKHFHEEVTLANYMTGPAEKVIFPPGRQMDS